SEPGHGTTFRLYLPRLATGDAAAAAPLETAAAATGGTETVLVVEDNQDMRRVVRRQLTGLGYRVIEAASAAAALERLEAEKIDLMLTDIVMPGEMDGIELARLALRYSPELKVVLTSGFP